MLLDDLRALEQLGLVRLCDAFVLRSLPLALCTCLGPAGCRSLPGNLFRVLTTRWDWVAAVRSAVPSAHKWNFVFPQIFTTVSPLLLPVFF